METTAIDKPKSVGVLTNNDIVFGPAIPAIDRLKIMSADEFEDLIREWVWGYLIPKKHYSDCKKSSGAGDKGRDVIAVIDESKNTWDNYQCKHYDHALMPTDIWVEIGKLCYYTFTNEYNIPSSYYFVSPAGIGPKLNLLLADPSTLRRELFAVWDKECKTKISSGIEVILTPELNKHIAKIDFSIFKAIDPQQLISELKTTSYFAARFGGGLLKKRAELKVPDELDKKEMVYTKHLLEAYSDHKKEELKSVVDLHKHEDLKEHFERQRISFYCADSLRQFSRDNLPPEVDYFEDLKSEVYTGVIDVYSKRYLDGYERLLATVTQAKVIQISSNALTNYTKQKDREGICHHLANDNQLIWVRK